MTNLLINQRFDFITLVIFFSKKKKDDKEGLRDPPSILSLCLCLLFAPWGQTHKNVGCGFEGFSYAKKG